MVDPSDDDLAQASVFWALMIRDDPAEMIMDVTPEHRERMADLFEAIAEALRHKGAMN